ncbi:AB-hydrolase YheT [Russula compacta]|nr:AB-hydrolase YheT [Russula compacta]
MGSLFRFPFSPSPHSKVAWPHAPAQLAVQARGVAGDSGKISLRKLIETRCPSALTPFKPAWGLFNAHLQILYAVAGDFTRVDQVTYDRKLLRLKDGGTVGLDFAPPAAAGRLFQETTPVVVALHGLTGGMLINWWTACPCSQEAYVRNIIAPAVAPVEEGGLGYRAVVVNSRGCAGVPLTSPQLYGLSHTDDFRQAIYYIAQMYPDAPLLGVGFSLGANLLTRYVAEESESCRLVSACVLSCPWDGMKSARSLESTWFRRAAYAKSLGTNLKRLVARNADSIQKFPDSSLAKALPALLAQPTARLTMRQFDDLVSIHCAGSSPPFPFADAWAYYAHSSSHNKLDAIRVPFLALSADDDPISSWVPCDYDRNGWVTIVVTCGGGHVGWFQSGGPANRWSKRPVLEWLKATAEDVRLGPRQVQPIELIDDWLVEVGREHLGCREIGDGGMIQGGRGQKGDLLSGL